MHETRVLQRTICDVDRLSTMLKHGGLLFVAYLQMHQAICLHP